MTWVNSGYSCPTLKYLGYVSTQPASRAGWVMSDWHTLSFIRFWLLVHKMLSLA